ncbi:MAG: ABC transporter permease [Bacillota bacterium]|jgi:ABC-2 type transport system permease protein|nr:ABC transporter permease [Bacillota bacterium]
MNTGRLLSDVYWVFWREMKRFFLQRSRLVMAVVQPVVWLVLMGNAMSGLTRNPVAARMLGTGNYLDFMVPGVMIMTALFGGVFGGTSVLWDRRLGFLNKMLTAPIYRAAIPLGKLLSLMVQSWSQVIIIVVIALILGVHIVTGLPGVLFMLLLASLFGVIMGGISLSLASMLKSIEALHAIMNFLTLPLMFTSNAMFPTQAMPVWLRRIADVNPLSYAVAPMRTVAMKGWIWQDLWVGLVALTLLAAVSTAVAIRQFHRSIA